MATLTVLQGPDRGRVFRTARDPALIGRSSNVVPLTDNTVSRRHAQLVPDNGRWQLVDLDSINGTFLNGQRVAEPITLKHGDQIRIGSSLLVFGGEDRPTEIDVTFFPSDSSYDTDLSSPALDSSILSRAPSSEDSVIIADQQTAGAVRSWRVMQSLIQATSSILSPDQLLERVMDTVFDEIRVDHGFILMRDEESGELLPHVVRRRTKNGTSDSGQVTTSETIVKHVISRKEGILCTNAQTDQRFAASKDSSIHSYGLRSVICAPIAVRDEVLGIIHIDSAASNRQLTEEQLRLMVAIGRQTGLALENLKLLSARMQTERLAATGETVAYLSHYIKNILQGMRSGADLIEMGLGKQNVKTVATGWPIVQRNLDKIYHLTTNMLAFSKDRQPSRQMVQLGRIVNEVVELVQRNADDRHVMLLAETEEEHPPIPVDPDGIHQVILNLIGNAIDAVEPHKGVINVKIKFDEEGQEAVITIADNGPGISSEDLPLIFEPFHSSKGQGGTGLGLAVAQKIVHEHNGRIDVSSMPGEGTIFRVRLPIAEAGPYESEETFGPRR
ncbi:MAG: FHA domain-containing protein [Phycisphaerae bacterium]|nr:FHA domain-containing protein [Phycisphaerae bacterium]